MPERVCIFCGQTPVTKEHVLPRWIVEVLAKDPRGLFRPITIKHRTAGGNRLSYRGAKGLEWTAKRVCATCNGGWMNDLEEAARSPLAALISGTTTTLSPTALQAMAAWGSKTLVMTRYAHVPVQPVPQHWLDQLYANRTPPESWHVFLTKYVGREPIFYGSHDVTLELEGQPDSGGIFATLIVGYLAIQFLALEHVGSTVGPGPARQIVAWPSPSEARWPPPAIVDDASLNDYANAFVSNPQSMYPG